MKTNELRIGNLITDEDGDTVIVEQVSGDNINKFTLVSRGDKNIYPSNIYPIPLTEECILKTPFVFDRSIGSRKIFCFGRLSLELLPDNKAAIYFDDNLFCFISAYVHSLQNLYFALTGEELTFKNKRK